MVPRQLLPQILPLLVVVVMTPSIVVVESTWIGPFPNGVPGSGYGCDNPCNTGDVNYVIEANLETYVVPGSKTTASSEKLGTGTTDLSMFTRTFVGSNESLSAYCNDDDDGSTGPLGPCITVNPGQQMQIKLINNLDRGMELLRQTPNTIEEYWKMASTPGQPDLDAITWFGQAPKTPQEMHVVNWEDIPGQQSSFDNVNLHFHGMQVVPHLFYPLGTGNPNADWITTTPGSADPMQQCFCYVIDVPSDHPQGTFWYHIHRHGAVAMQAWEGMVGYLLVGDATTPGSPEYELAQQNVTRDEMLALWEWAVAANLTVLGEPNTLIEPDFLSPAQEQVFLTNNQYAPSFDMCVNETVHYRLLCAQTTTGSALYLYDDNEQVIQFYVFASDGISYNQTYAQTAIVIGPGQREGLLLQFNTPGTYRLMQDIINDFQDGGEDVEAPLPAAYFVVSDNCTNTDYDPNVDPSQLVFTPGIPLQNTITPDMIARQVDVTFMVQSELDSAPVPQFVINGELFDYRRNFDTIEVNTSQQWTLTSNMDYFHPFHIHLNPFQVVSVNTAYVPGVLPGNITLADAVEQTNIRPPMMWRDTVFIPPFGQTIIVQRFGEENAFAGKTVFHCHFLDHEDQGMIAAFLISNPDDPYTNATSSGRATQPTYHYGSWSFTQYGFVTLLVLTASTIWLSM